MIEASEYQAESECAARGANSFIGNVAIALGTTEIDSFDI